MKIKALVFLIAAAAANARAGQTLVPSCRNSRNTVRLSSPYRTATAKERHAYAFFRNLVLDVFVNNGERIPFATLQPAEVFASRILAIADVRISWHGATRSGWKGRNRVIVIRLEMNTPVAYHPGALGYSLVYEGVHVAIFYDRIRQMDRQTLETLLLAHAMAHEITHLLQGVERHSETGVMKAHWDSRDFFEMKCHLLTFTPEDIEMIRKANARPDVMAARIP